MDDVIAVLDDFGFLQPSQKDDRSAFLFAESSRFDGFWGVAFMAGEDDHRVGSEILWGGMEEFIAVVPTGFDSRAFCFNERFSGIKSPETSTATDEIELLDTADTFGFGEGFLDSGLDLLGLLIHG